ncbi:MAG: hypothetical protein J0I28_11915 [Caulobacterales bacterium]|nr:hypothetical protein [Caulobacterales bacterium]
MQVQGEHIEETPTEARQGENVKGMTTVLRVSTALAVVALAVVLLFYVF